MSGFELVLVMALAAWLTVLTLIVVVLTKQAVLITGRMTSISDISNGSNFIGMPIPEQTEALVRNALGDVDPYAIVILSSTCSPCRNVLEDTPDWPGRMAVAVAIEGREESEYATFKGRIPSHMLRATPLAPTVARCSGWTSDRRREDRHKVLCRGCGPSEHPRPLGGDVPRYRQSHAKPLHLAV
jgi:hypothetical protein